MKPVRSKAWEIAADLETAAHAIGVSRQILDGVHISAMMEVEAIMGIEFVDRDMQDALQALSDKYQAIADAEIEA